jgi:hypothetical protein
MYLKTCNIQKKNEKKADDLALKNSLYLNIRVSQG